MAYVHLFCPAAAILKPENVLRAGIGRWFAASDAVAASGERRGEVARRWAWRAQDQDRATVFPEIPAANRKSGGSSGVSGLAGGCPEAGEGRGTKADSCGGRSRPGDCGSDAAHGARQEACAEFGGAGAVVREAEGVAVPRPHQCVWKRAAIAAAV